MQVNSTTTPPIITKLHEPKVMDKVKKIAVPSLLATGSVLLATKQPKNAVSGMKMTTRLTRAGIVGIAMAAILTLVNITKNEAIEGVNRVKEIFRKTDGEKALEKSENQNVELGKPTEPTAPIKPMEPAEKKEPENQASTNPFADGNQAPQESVDFDKVLKEAENLTSDNSSNLNKTEEKSTQSRPETKNFSPLFLQPQQNSNTANPFANVASK